MPDWGRRLVGRANEQGRPRRRTTATAVALAFAGFALTSASASASTVEEDGQEVTISFEPSEADGLVPGGGVDRQYEDGGLLGVTGLAIDPGQGSHGSHALGPFSSEFCCRAVTLTFDTDWVIDAITFDVSGGDSFSSRQFPLRVTALDANGSEIANRSVVIDQVADGPLVWTTVTIDSGGPAIATLTVSSAPENPSSPNDFEFPWFLDNVRYTRQPPVGATSLATSVPAVSLSSPYDAGRQTIELVRTGDAGGLELTDTVQAITGHVRDQQALSSVVAETPEGDVTLCEGEDCAFGEDGQWAISASGGPFLPPPVDGRFEVTIIATNLDGNTDSAVIELEGLVVGQDSTTDPTADGTDEVEDDNEPDGTDNSEGGGDGEPAGPSATETTSTSEEAVSDGSSEDGEGDEGPNAILFWVGLMLFALVGWVSYRLIQFLTHRRTSTPISRTAPDPASPPPDPSAPLPEAKVRADIGEGSATHAIDPEPELTLHAHLDVDEARVVLLERTES